MGRTVKGRAVVPGQASGTVLRSEDPISLWGSVDPETGRIIDPRVDRCGESIAGRVFVLPGEKGSSTGSAVLLELARRELAPAALITASLAPVAALGAIVAETLYNITIPVMRVSPEELAGIEDGERLEVTAEGVLSLD